MNAKFVKNLKRYAKKLKLPYSAVKSVYCSLNKEEQKRYQQEINEKVRRLRLTT